MMSDASTVRIGGLYELNHPGCWAEYIDGKADLARSVTLKRGTLLVLLTTLRRWHFLDGLHTDDIGVCLTPDGARILIALQYLDLPTGMMNP